METQNGDTEEKIIQWTEPSLYVPGLYYEFSYNEENSSFYFTPKTNLIFTTWEHQDFSH